MSDCRLRELERRWRETGSVEDEAAYLRERVRVGNLTEEKLELAAYCGHEGAMHATGACRRVAPIKTDAEWQAWVKELDERWGASVSLQAYAVGFAQVVLPRLAQNDEIRSSSYPSWAQGLIARLEAWVRDPSDQNLAAIRNYDLRCYGLVDNPGISLRTLPAPGRELARAVLPALAFSALICMDSG